MLIVYFGQISIWRSDCSFLFLFLVDGALAVDHLDPGVAGYEKINVVLMVLTSLHGTNWSENPRRGKTIELKTPGS